MIKGTALEVPGRMMNDETLSKCSVHKVRLAFGGKVLPALKKDQIFVLSCSDEVILVEQA